VHLRRGYRTDRTSAHRQSAGAQQQAPKQYSLQAVQYARQWAAVRQVREHEAKAKREAAAEELFAMSANMLCLKKRASEFLRNLWLAGVGTKKSRSRPRRMYT